MALTSKNNQIIHGLLPLLLIAAIGLAIYSNTLGVPFYFDDHPNIVDNTAIRITSLTPAQLLTAGRDSLLKTRPVANISFALNYYFHRYEVTGYHLVNIVIHICTGLLFFLLLRVTLTRPAVGLDRHHATLPALIGSLLWLAHPVQTQSITYIVQRMNSMAAMFYLLALLLYVYGRLVGSKPRKVMLFLGTGLAGLLAIGSKEIAASLPIFILLYEWFFLQDLNRVWLKKHLPLTIAMLAMLAGLGLLFLGTSPLETILGGYGGRDFTLAERLLTQPRVVLYLMGLLLLPLPSRLTLDYDFTLSHSLFDPVTTLPALLVLAALLGLAIILARRHRLVSFTILWFLGNLAIESSFIPLEIIYEHRLYLPSMFGIAVVPFLLLTKVHFYRPKVIACVGLIMLLGFWTYQRNGVWNDPVAFGQDGVLKAQGKARPHNNLGAALSKQNRIDEAIAEFNLALRLDPTSAESYNNLGEVLQRQGKFNEAISYYRRAIELAPSPNNISNLGACYQQIGQYDEAYYHQVEALRLEPGRAESHNNMGLTLLKLNRLPEAVKAFQQALAIAPDMAKAHNNLGLALGQSGNLDGAMRHFNRALELQPIYAEAHNNLGVASFQRGQLQQASNHFRQALTMDPNHAQAQRNLALVQSQLAGDQPR